MAKPDNRADNAEKLQRMVQNTIENHRETEQYLAQHGDELSAEQREQIERNNRNREQSIKGMREEIKDEIPYRR